MICIACEARFSVTDFEQEKQFADADDAPFCPFCGAEESLIDATLPDTWRHYDRP